MVTLRVLGGLLLAVVVVLGVYLFVLRPRSLRWGATDAEVTRSLPGDELVPNVKVGYTQAITISAPPEEVWPWVIQMGYGRAGWYTYDWFYKLTGSGNFHDGNRSANRIIPELQDLKVGDPIKIFETAPYDVVILEPNRVLALLARVDWDTEETFELSETMPANFMNNSWVYVLEPADANSSRLLVRWRGDYSFKLGNALALGIPTEAGALIMQPKMFKGIKARAEGAAAGR
ncbi:MAG TPA: hypothetical protein VM537_28260 [Anaerolineae bacterium]|nr:hypothetical protein [Anaerolineae bacterium]